MQSVFNDCSKCLLLEIFVLKYHHLFCQHFTFLKGFIFTEIYIYGEQCRDLNIHVSKNYIYIFMTKCARIFQTAVISNKTITVDMSKIK